jgi:hypothetical protein
MGASGFVLRRLAAKTSQPHSSRCSALTTFANLSSIGEFPRMNDPATGRARRTSGVDYGRTASIIRALLIQRMVMSSKSIILFAAGVILAPVSAQPFEVERITASVSAVSGPVNGVLIQRNGETLAIYGDPRPEPAKVRRVLFTHHRRDVVWAGGG